MGLVINLSTSCSKSRSRLQAQMQLPGISNRQLHLISAEKGAYCRFEGYDYWATATLRIKLEFPFLYLKKFASIRAVLSAYF